MTGKPYYAEALRKALDEAREAIGVDPDEARQRIAEITARLINEPMSDVERIMLCEDRASLRKFLAGSANQGRGAGSANG